MKKTLFLFFSLILLLDAFASDKVSFQMTINGLSTNYNVFSIFVMPDDTIDIQFTGNSSDQFVGNYSQGKLIEDDRLNWRFVVSNTPGHYLLEILHNSPPEKLLLNIFVKVPALKQGVEYLNGYRIGNYPQKPYRDNPKYLPPEGFIEVTENNKEVYITPHFQLKQFLCKQQPNHWPKYLLLDSKLLYKLELVIDRLNKKRGVNGSLFIMSGYRTPYYNSAIGQGKYSRHIYGDAADVYVDNNNDSEIDDLNNDGKASMADAHVIYQVVEAIEGEAKYKQLIGGMGKYNKTSTHTWDVHIDTRGYPARW